MKKVHQNRLLKLADKLDSLPRKQFDLDYWVIPESESGCGTVACAAGHAAMMPEFQKEGFSLVSGAPAIEDENGNLCFGFTACELFFGIDRKEAGYLFWQMNYKNGDRTTPKTVAKRLRKFVEERK